MKVKEDVLRKLDNYRGWGLVMMTLDCSPTTARSYVKSNHERLTLPVMTRAIGEYLKVSQDEILEEATEMEGQK